MASVWDAVKDLDRRRHGFDHPRGFLPHFAVAALEHGKPGYALPRPPVEEDVAGSFQAIAELAGYVAALFPLDPERRAQCEYAAVFAEMIEDQARGLLHVLRQRLNDYEETESE